MFETLRDALRKFWDAARALFGGKIAEDKSKEDYADMVLADLVGGVNPNNEIEAVNARFNEELEAFDKGERGNLHLGYPSRILRACGIDSTEMFIKPRVLREHLNKHGLTIEDIKDLPKAMSNPLMVYEWGTQAKSLIVITELTTSDGRKITAAIKLERQGKRAEVNEIASVHGKEAEYFINEMNNAKGGGLANALRYIGDKKKVLDWLGLDPPKGSPSLTNQELSVAKILNNFENPRISRESFSENIDTEREKNRVKYQKSDNNLRFRGEEEPVLFGMNAEEYYNTVILYERNERYRKKIPQDNERRAETNAGNC